MNVTFNPNTSGTRLNENVAWWPDLLEELVLGLKYKKNWEFTLRSADRGQGSIGLTLCILISTPNSYNQDEMRNVMHYKPVPPAAYNLQSWQRWLLDQILEVESHEACEYFTIDGKKPFAPNHGPGCDPYRIVEYATDEDRRTSYKGVLKD